MTATKADLAEHIREMGYRMTPQRELVLDAVGDLGGHATAVQIGEYVQKQQPFVNRATIYRALDFWCDVQVVTKTEIAGKAVYEMAGEKPHHHLVCRGCGYVSVLDDHLFAELSQHLLDEYGFEAEMVHFAISGLCAGCRDEDQ